MAQQVVLLEYQQTLIETEDRLARLEGAWVLAGAASPPHPLLEARHAWREIDLVTAATRVAELGDLQRFRHRHGLTAYMGWAPVITPWGSPAPRADH